MCLVETDMFDIISQCAQPVSPTRSRYVANDTWPSYPSFQTSYPPPPQQATYQSSSAQMQPYSYQSQQSLPVRSFNQPNQVVHRLRCSYEYNNS